MRRRARRARWCGCRSAHVGPAASRWRSRLFDLPRHHRHAEPAGVDAPRSSSQLPQWPVRIRSGRPLGAQPLDLLPALDSTRARRARRCPGGAGRGTRAGWCRGGGSSARAEASRRPRLALREGDRQVLERPPAVAPGERQPRRPSARPKRLRDAPVEPLDGEREEPFEAGEKRRAQRPVAAERRQRAAALPRIARREAAQRSAPQASRARSSRSTSSRTAPRPPPASVT